MESACPEKSFPQLPKSGTHTRRTPTNRAPAKPSPVHTGGTGSPSATAVAPDMPDTPRPCRSSPQAPSDSEGILPPSPHTTYWGYLSQGDTHLHRFRGSGGPLYHDFSNHRWNRPFHGCVRHPY